MREKVDGNTIVGAFQAGFVRVWDGMGAPIGAPMIGHTTSVYGIARWETTARSRRNPRETASIQPIGVSIISANL